MRIEALFTAWALSAGALAGADAVTGTGGEHSLQVDAGAATAAIAPRTNGRAAIRLPALEFVFRLRPTCAEPFRANSISLTVADSRQALDAEQLEDKTATPELRLTVPAGQIAPVLVSDFCSAQTNAENAVETASDRNGEPLTLSATLSANASLLCVSENEREIVYTVAPLDVTLVCESIDTMDE